MRISMNSSSLKKIKKKDIENTHILDLFSIDYTTRVEVAGWDVGGRYRVYVSGGKDSCGFFLEFGRGGGWVEFRNLEEEIAISNAKIFMDILKLTISYHTFIFNMLR